MRIGYELHRVTATLSPSDPLSGFGGQCMDAVYELWITVLKQKTVMKSITSEVFLVYILSFPLITC